METKCKQLSLDNIKKKKIWNMRIVSLLIQLEEKEDWHCSGHRKLASWNYSQFHIHAQVTEADLNSSWYLTGFYENPDSSKRHQSSSLLLNLNNVAWKMWCVIYDFNKSLLNRRYGKVIQGQLDRLNNFRMHWQGMDYMI